METDTERLQHECLAYDKEMKARQERLRGLEKTLTNNLFPPSADETQENVVDRYGLIFTIIVQVVDYYSL
jgi:hypothetical protein